jgi:hypothetical protein
MNLIQKILCVAIIGIVAWALAAFIILVLPGARDY